MSEARKIIVVGGGPAGTWAAIAAKKQDRAAEVTVLNAEHCEPYEKPPLSKAVLVGKAQAGDAPIAGPGGLAAHGVRLERNANCVAIDRTRKTVATAAGTSFVYDALVLATGAYARELPHLPAGMARVHYLRTEADAGALKQDLAKARNLVVIGAGLIGLEVASSARALGVDVIVLEVGPRILARVTDEETGALLHATHVAHGVDIRLATRISGARPLQDGGIAVLIGEETLAADLVVVGAGTVADTRLAQAAGLACEDGIIVDVHARTSDPAIFAAGDAARFPGPHGPARLEDWRHAQDHGAVAGTNAAGGEALYRPLPSFWSEQYDRYLQGVGWAAVSPGDCLHRNLPDNASIMFRTESGRLVYALAINAQRDIAAARRLIERNIPIDAARLTDPTQKLADMLKRPA